jgi:shikimate dehydrogenase
MIPMDVEAINIRSLLDALEQDRRFLGGAIAIPYKEVIAGLLGERLTPEAMMLRTVNCLFREQGRIYGTNTDGEGAQTAFETQYGSLKGRNVLLLGPGGAGKAVALAFHTAVGTSGSVTVAGRSPSNKGFTDRVGIRLIDWTSIAKEINHIDVLVNCTPIGTGMQAGLSPIHVDLLTKLPSGAIVFDINYRPCPTVLLESSAKLGIDTMDGIAMNLEQAILAYGYAAPSPLGPDVTRTAMREYSTKLS